jgi:arginine deiminase
MNKQIKIEIKSEIDPIKTVILHTPGSEVENMNPENAERALYSDILNLSVARNEYLQFSEVLSRFAQTLEISDLLREVLELPVAREALIGSIADESDNKRLVRRLEILSAPDLSIALIEGLNKCNDTLTDFLRKGRFSLKPLHNFFFTRDSAVVYGNDILISKMASKVRARETSIMDIIFNYHPLFQKQTITHEKDTGSDENIRFEGGDIIIAREDILIIGNGLRTSTQGIDFIIDEVKSHGEKKYILVQELPSEPESFIHLDMVFTFLDTDKCMVFEPVVLKSNKYHTVLITVDNGKVSKIEYVSNIPAGLKKLGMDMQAVFCGGKKDEWVQEREQWHSGANFFTLAPGKVMGYGRNTYTMEEMNRNGFEIIKAKDIIKNKVSIQDIKKFVIALEGDELARGGGGARCMTMPVSRKAYT